MFLLHATPNNDINDLEGTTIAQYECSWGDDSPAKSDSSTGILNSGIHIANCEGGALRGSLNRERWL